MNLRKNLTTLLVSGLCAVGLTGCDDPAQLRISPQEVTIQGKPKSVGESYGQYDGAMAIVIETDGKNLLGYAYGNDTRSLAEGQTLIQAEIAKGTNGSISLKGKYDYLRFKIHLLTADGYYVRFK